MENKNKIIQQLKSRIKKLEKSLLLTESSFMHIVEHSRAGIVVVDDSGCVIYANPSALRIFGVDMVDFLGEPVGIPVPVNRPIEIEVLNRSGDKTNAEVNVFGTQWQGLNAYLFTLRDLSEQKKVEAELGYMSQHDALTGMPNRRVFNSVLNRTIKRSLRHNLYFAILFMDLDHFKEVNDKFGHSVGDRTLKEVSSILRFSVRESDLVVRLGGDEFAIVLDFIELPHDAAVVAQKIIDTLSKPMNIVENQIQIGVSIGIAVYPFAGKDKETLIKNADSAMYMAKNAGGNQFKYYRVDVDGIARRKMQLEVELLSAIHRNEFYTLYQPFIDLKSNKVMGMESLLRWKNKKLGNVLIDEFFPLAEKLKLMNIIGCLAVSSACDEYLSHSMDHLMLSVNMSIGQLNSESFIDCVLKKINHSKMKSGNFSLEITENAIMSEPQVCIEKLKRLSKMGIRLLIDDYGSGYSSLSYLQKLPVDFLKIDQSFIQDIDINISNAHIVQSTIGLAHNLGLKVIAEGVETKAQAEFLRRSNCDYAQGFYYSKPVDMATIKRMIG